MHIYTHTHASTSYIVEVEKHEVYTAGLSLAPLTYFENPNAASTSLSVSLWIRATAALLHLHLSTPNIYNPTSCTNTPSQAHTHTHTRVYMHTDRLLKSCCVTRTSCCAVCSLSRWQTEHRRHSEEHRADDGDVEGKTTTISAFFRAPAAQSQLILSPYERRMNFAWCSSISARKGMGVGGGKMPT